MKKIDPHSHIHLCFFLFFCTLVFSQQHDLVSPNGDLKLQVFLDSGAHWELSFKDRAVLAGEKIGMNLDNVMLKGSAKEFERALVSAEDVVVKPVVPNKDSTISVKYNQLILQFNNGYSLEFRLYDDGLAYRFLVADKKYNRVIKELMDLSFPKGTISIFPKEESTYSHNERSYLQMGEEDFHQGDFCSLPVLFDTGSAKILFTEADLNDYPGMFLAYDRGLVFGPKHPGFVLSSVPHLNNSPDRNEILTVSEEFIAEIAGPRSYPWRVFIVSDDDRTFVESNLVTILSGASKLEDASWIEPGKVAWDWYNANNIYGVDFEAGINTETYKYYIDFAADNGVEYVILDEGWTKSTTEITDWNKNMDVPELISYGKERNVGIILWVLWKPLQQDVDGILKLYSSWGAKGVKVDFMQRNDQAMVRSYEEIARTAAKYKLLVDYHGAFKPAGLERKWPNIINYEGVKGNEHNKWSADINPEHNLTIPFIRMAAGPMDFTPGAMINKNSRNFSVSFFRPMSLGTRCHQMAMYVVFEAPLQMLCESPSTYRREQECVDFMTEVPTTWDETRVIHGKVSDYIFVARRKGDKWYLGGMTDDSPRKLEVPLDFLGEGQFEMEYFQDGPNAKNFAQDYLKRTSEVDQNDIIQLEMAAGGGWVGSIRAK